MQQAVATGSVAANGAEETARAQRRFWGLTLGSIGVVYGDIGTSPLYAVRESVLAAVGPHAPASEEVILGLLSLIVWALILIVSIKYVTILLLLLVLLQPRKVRFPCPACGLQRHDFDAVHCKACGTILNIPDEGAV